MRSRMSILLLLAIVFISSAELSITHYGLAQYRLRERINTAFTEQSSSTAFDYFNTVSYYAGIRADLDETFSFHFQVGNDWVAVENVSWEANRMPFPTRMPLSGSEFYVHLAYSRWNPGFLYLEAGAVPVVSYGPLDLLERSVNSGSYRAAALYTWIVGTNNSLLGLRVGAPILSGEQKLNVNLFSTVVDPRSAAVTQGDSLIESPRSNPTSVLFILDAPFTAGALSITPQLAGIAYRNFNPAREAGDHEISGGVKAGYKVNSTVTLSAMAAYAMVNNENSRISDTRRSDTSTAPLYDNRGFITAISSDIGAGPGAFWLEFAYSYAVDKEQAGSASDHLYADVRYTWKVHPNFSITPRFRNFTSINPENSRVKVNMENRPEIMFTGTF
ncbi:MAG: hypothetical protein ACOCW1_05305 [Chitinispirillaceae bacterium]